MIATLLLLVALVVLIDRIAWAIDKLTNRK